MANCPNKQQNLWPAGHVFYNNNINNNNNNENCHWQSSQLIVSPSVVHSLSHYHRHHRCICHLYRWHLRHGWWLPLEWHALPTTTAIGIFDWFEMCSRARCWRARQFNGQGRDRGGYERKKEKYLKERPHPPQQLQEAIRRKARAVAVMKMKMKMKRVDWCSIKDAPHSTLDLDLDLDVLMMKMMMCYGPALCRPFVYSFYIIYY